MPVHQVLPPPKFVEGGLPYYAPAGSHWGLHSAIIPSDALPESVSDRVIDSASGPSRRSRGRHARSVRPVKIVAKPPSESGADITMGSASRANSGSLAQTSGTPAMPGAFHSSHEAQVRQYLNFLSAQLAHLLQVNGTIDQTQTTWHTALDPSLSTRPSLPVRIMDWLLFLRLTWSQKGKERARAESTSSSGSVYSPAPLQVLQSGEAGASNGLCREQH